MKKKKLTGKELEAKIKSDVDTIMRNRLSVVAHENNSKHLSSVTHLTIVGGVRRVEYYPSTGTVYANKVSGKFKQANGKGVFDAIRIAIEGE